MATGRDYREDEGRTPRSLRVGIVIYVLIAALISVGVAWNYYRQRHPTDAPENMVTFSTPTTAPIPTATAQATPTAAPTDAPTATPSPTATPTPTPSPTATPVASIGEYTEGFSVSTSSYRVNRDRSILVGGEQAIDGDLNTAWNTDKNTPGEWIELSVRDGRRYQIEGFSIANGYWKSNKAYRRNARVRTLDVYCDGAFVQRFDLLDEREFQSFDFNLPKVCGRIRFVIVDGYAGSSYEDCCITEIVLY